MGQMNRIVATRCRIIRLRRKAQEPAGARNSWRLARLADMLEARLLKRTGWAK